MTKKTRRTLETLNGYRIYDDGSCFSTHLFTIEKKENDLWRRVSNKIYVDWKEAHQALTEFANGTRKLEEIESIFRCQKEDADFLLKQLAG